MTSTYIQLPDDGSGKKVQSWSNSIGGQTVHTQASTLVDSSGVEVDDTVLVAWVGGVIAMGEQRWARRRPRRRT